MFFTSSDHVSNCAKSVIPNQLFRLDPTTASQLAGRLSHPSQHQSSLEWSRSSFFPTLHVPVFSNEADMGSSVSYRRGPTPPIYTLPSSIFIANISLSPSLLSLSLTYLCIQYDSSLRSLIHRYSCTAVQLYSCSA